MTVFLSYSTPIRCDQQALLIAIEQIFKDQDVDVKTVENVRSTENPISAIIATLGNCDSLLCLAFEKYCSVTNRQLCYHTSPWLDIEIALALQRAIPILVLKEKHIARSPLLDSNKKSYPILEIETNYCNNAYKIDSANFVYHIAPVIKSWIEQQADS